MVPKLSISELREFLTEEFPRSIKLTSNIELTNEELFVEMPTDDCHLRPGGSVSGPTMFMLADLTAYYLILIYTGKKPLSVTTSCSMDFMRKPIPGIIMAKAKILKLGRRLSVCDVLIFSKGMNEPVARATLTYSLQP